AGIAPAGFDHDLSLYAFLLDADPGGCSLQQLVQRRLDLRLADGIEHHALHLIDLHQKLYDDIGLRNLRELYETIELPLARVLARMEHAGMAVDRTELDRLSELMEAEISRLTADIHQLAGREFNISSPQQL